MLNEKEKTNGDWGAYESGEIWMFELSKNPHGKGSPRTDNLGPKGWGPGGHGGMRPRAISGGSRGRQNDDGNRGKEKKHGGSLKGGHNGMQGLIELKNKRLWGNKGLVEETKNRL